MLHDGALVNHVTKLGIDVKKIGLVNALSSVPYTFTWHNTPEAMLHAIQYRCSNTSASGASNNDASININGAEIASQIGAKECRGILFNYDVVSLMRCNALFNFDHWILLGPSPQQSNLLGEHPAVTGMSVTHLGVHNRNSFGSAKLNQRLRLFDRISHSKATAVAIEGAAGSDISFGEVYDNQCDFPSKAQLSIKDTLVVLQIL